MYGLAEKSNVKNYERDQLILIVIIWRKRKVGVLWQGKTKENTYLIQGDFSRERTREPNLQGEQGNSLHVQQAGGRKEIFTSEKLKICPFGLSLSEPREFRIE